MGLFGPTEKDKERAFKTYCGFLQLVGLRLQHLRHLEVPSDEANFHHAWEEALRMSGGNRRNTRGADIVKAGELLDRDGITDDLHEALMAHLRLRKAFTDFKPDYRSFVYGS